MLTELTRALNGRPTYLFFTVTSRCNAFCDFCWNWENVQDAGKFARPGRPSKRAELTLDEIDRFTRKLPPMLLVDLFGGEPFLREDLAQVIALFVRNARTQYISIPTNGFYTDKILSDIGSSLRAFPDTGFRLYLSIDGPAEVHNPLRKLKNGYENAVATARGLAALRAEHPNLSVSCNMNYNRVTQHRMREFVGEVMSWQLFDSIAVDLVRGEPVDPEMLLADQERYREIQEMIRSYRLTSNQPFSPLHKAIEQKTSTVVQRSLLSPERRVFNCFAGKKLLLLTDTGDVFPCEHLLKTPLGNIREHDYDLEALLRQEQAKAIRKDIVDRKCNCRWECAINTSNIFDIRNYPDLIRRTAVNILRHKLDPDAP